MTTKVRINEVTLDTTEGRVTYSFTSNLTVLAGPTGVGKTTLLELIKYGLGCDGTIAPVAEEHVNDVTVDITIGSSRLAITRSLDASKGRRARVTDITTHERLRDHNTDSKEPSLSALLLTAIGLPADMRAAARTGSSSRAGGLISFADIFSFMYVAQSAINRDIAHSQETYREPKRKAVFELLFGLTDAGILRMRSELTELNGEVERAETEHRTVLAFLRDSGTTSRAAAEQAMAEAHAQEALAKAEQAELRDVLDPVADRDTLTLRDLLTNTEQALADARALVLGLARQQAEYAAERRRVQSDLDRYHRMRAAGEMLADIEFTVCPRCMQSLTERPVPQGACRVCLQEDPVGTGDFHNPDSYEASQLAEQLAEMDGQLELLGLQRGATSTAVTDREYLVKSLSADLDVRTSERITPRLQAFTDTVERLATSRTRKQQLELVLRQWDRADAIRAEADRFRNARERKLAEIAVAESRLASRKEQVLANIDQEFQEAVNAIGIPEAKTVSIHRTRYLPLLNGRMFNTVSNAGGIITTVQVAYWTSLLAVAMRSGGADEFNETYYPTLLIIDSPRLALNDQEALSGALYRRLVTQADAGRGNIQFIIADNELPASYRSHYAQRDFSYKDPTISTIRHEGRASANPISHV
jgi:hypothetical protein